MKSKFSPFIFVAFLIFLSMELIGQTPFFKGKSAQIWMPHDTLSRFDWSSTGQMKNYYRADFHQKFFCKMEERLLKKNNLWIKIRLGDQNEVDRMEYYRRQKMQ
jgi:hypothetical protein